MTELAELVQIGLINEDETECPFDHEAPEPPHVENDLVGVGSTLATRMADASSTHLYEEHRKQQKLQAVPNPRDDETHALYQKGSKKPRLVVVRARKDAAGKVYEHKYPITCAAHHCIPAQESLKRSQLLEYMVKEGDSERLKEGKSYTTFENGVVWSDIGYDVNGIENGVYLPGNYAVGGGTGGMGVWEGSDGNKDDDDEVPTVLAATADVLADAVESPAGVSPLVPTIVDSAPSSNRLSGDNFQVGPNNRKWGYVLQAMQIVKGQFHDRHEPYSNHVFERLEKIYSNYVLLEEAAHFACDKCKQREDKIFKHGMPTPYGLVARLNGISAFLRAYLTGSLWSARLYTSRWVKAYADSRSG